MLYSLTNLLSKSIKLAGLHLLPVNSGRGVVISCILPSYLRNYQNQTRQGLLFLSKCGLLCYWNRTLKSELNLYLYTHILPFTFCFLLSCVQLKGKDKEWMRVENWEAKQYIIDFVVLLLSKKCGMRKPIWKYIDISWMNWRNKQLSINVYTILTFLLFHKEIIDIIYKNKKL